MVSKIGVLFTSCCLLLLSGSLVRQAGAAPAGGDWPELPVNVCMAPIGPVILENPTVISSCTESNLRAALAEGGHIRLECGDGPVTIAIDSPLVTSASEDIVLDGGGLVTLDGQNSTRIIEKPFTPGSHLDPTLGNDLTLQNLRLINGRAPAASGHQDANARGGAVWATSPGSRLHIINSVFQNNATSSIEDEDNQGGAVYAANIYETVIVSSVFEGNVAGNGGAFGAIASGLIVANSRFTGNVAADGSAGGIVRGHGGAIHLDGVSNSFNATSNHIVHVCGSEFSGNSAVRGGGAIKVTVSDNKGTKASYLHSTFDDNRLVGSTDVEGHGGAIYHIEDDYTGGNNEDNLEIRASTFSNNYAHRQGGGAWILIHGRGRIENSTFSDNRAATAGSNLVGQGGGLIVSMGLLEIVNSTFAWNFATFQGGAIHAGGEGDAGRQVTLSNSLFYENRLDPSHTNPVTTEWQGYHSNRPLQNGGNNLQFPRDKAPHWSNTVNNFIVMPETAILFADALLQNLDDYGGPTAVRALPTGSPAIDAGGAGACAHLDQRGVVRDQGGGCDIGAYERVVGLRVSPAQVAVDEAILLTVRGSDFSASDTVLWAGLALPTTFVNSLTLQASVDGQHTATAGVVQVTVAGSDLAPASTNVVNSLEKLFLPFIR